MCNGNLKYAINVIISYRLQKNDIDTEWYGWGYNIIERIAILRRWGEVQEFIMQAIISKYYGINITLDNIM